tara:strand:- start:2414 stop:2578 length:165 start_codon:yes stop_codon:yes gene_type:complete
VKIHRKEAQRENVLELPLPLYEPSPTDVPQEKVKKEIECVIDTNKCDLDDFIVD